MMGIDPGVILRFIFVVPSFASGNRRRIVLNNRTRKPILIPEERVDAYRAHLRACFAQVRIELSRRDDRFRAIEFPIAGKDCPLRVDLLFGFKADDDGSHRRMKLSDIDNLRKTTQDALEGELYDNDRYIVEGFTAIGEAPAIAKGDVIWCLVSRAGYRTGKQMELIHFNDGFGVLPPWRPIDGPGAAMIGRPPSLIVPDITPGVPEKKMN